MRTSLSFLLITVIGVVMSDPKVEPGTKTPSLLVTKHWLKTFLCRLFHMQEAWKMKLFFAKSKLTLGTVNSILVSFGLFFGNSNSDTGVVYFNILKVSQKVW